MSKKRKELDALKKLVLESFDAADLLMETVVDTLGDANLTATFAKYTELQKRKMLKDPDVSDSDVEQAKHAFDTKLATVLALRKQQQKK